MAGSVDDLLAVDPRGLSFDERLAHLVELQRVEGRLAAATQRTLALLEAEPAPIPSLAEARSKQWVREEVACLLRICPSVAASRLAEAAELVGRFPDALELVDDGAISLLHARSLVEATRSLPDGVAARVQARVLGRAPEQTLSGFRRCLRTAVERLDPRGQEQKHRDALAERRVCLTPEDHGMAWLNAYLPAADATAMLTAVQALADKTATGGATDDERTAEQRRADALVALCTAPLTGGSVELPTQQGRRPAVQITLALSTLLALDEQPGELAGYGPVPAAVARALAVDATASWRWLLTDDEGRLLDLSRTTYQPSAALRDYVIARDRTCRFPGCTRQARRCDLDHVVPYDGTNTTIDNLHALCCRHHHAKHRAGWTVHRRPDGVTEWRSPTGRRYDKPPDPYPRDSTVDPPGDEPPTF